MTRVETGFKTEDTAHAALDNRIRERDATQRGMQEMDVRADNRRNDAAWEVRTREIDRTVESLVAMREDDYLETQKLAAEQRASGFALREREVQKLVLSTKGKPARSLARKMQAAAGLSPME